MMDTTTRQDRPIAAVARVRKRCPNCQKMIEVGESAILTDDRYLDSKVQWFGRSYQRGAWHLWHPACHQAMRGEQP